MSEPSAKRFPAHLTLVELLIVILLLGGAAFLTGCATQQDRHRDQLRQISIALDKRDDDAVWKLCKANPELVHSNGGSFSFTPLHLAAIRGNKDMVQWLLDRHADPNTRVSYISMPLHFAVIHNHKDVAELLLTRSADVNAKDRFGYTPLYWAILYCHNDLAAFLRKHGATESVVEPVAPADGK